MHRGGRPTSGRPLKQVTDDIIHFGSLRCFKHFEVDARSGQELVVTLRARQRSAADATTAGARGDGGEEEHEEEGGRDACDGSQVFLIGAFTRYNYPHVWRLKAPHHAGDCGADADAHESQDRPLPLESIRLWKTKNTRVWDFVRELLTTYGGLSEHENPFAVDFHSLRRMDSAGGFEIGRAHI